MTKSQYDRLKSGLEKKKSLLNNLYATAEKLSANPKETFSMDTSDGRVAAKYRDLDEIYKRINILERQIDFDERRLCRAGNIQYSLKRAVYG